MLAIAPQHILDTLHKICFCSRFFEVFPFTVFAQLRHSQGLQLTICCQALHAKALQTSVSDVYTVVSRILDHHVKMDVFIIDNASGT